MLVRNKSASVSFVIPKACLDQPWQGAQIDQNNPSKSDVIVLLYKPAFVHLSTLSRPGQGPVKTASREVGVSRLVTKVEAGPTLKACYGQPWRYVTSRSEGSRSRLSLTCYEEALNVGLWLPYASKSLPRDMFDSDKYYSVIPTIEWWIHDSHYVMVWKF